MEKLLLPPFPTHPGAYVLRVRACPTCYGQGWFHNPQWEQVYLLVNQGFRFSTAARQVFGTDPEDWPPEEEECRACHGRGVVYAWQSLEMAQAEADSQNQTQTEKQP